jgi:hypothetical protein
MFEAWANDVPTLVWNRGYWKYGKNTWKDDKISSPYLCKECGIFFRGIDDFVSKYELMQKSNFSPRKFVSDNFTHEKISQNFINLINL